MNTLFILATLCILIILVYIAILLTKFKNNVNKVIVMLLNYITDSKKFDKFFEPSRSIYSGD